MLKRVEILLLAAVVAASLVGVGGARAEQPAGVGTQVRIANMAFSPATLTVPAGTTVTWVNHDGDSHSVESSDKRFPSSTLLNTGETYAYTFTTPGTYKYHCGVHSFMTGKIVVTGAPSAATGN